MSFKKKEREILHNKIIEAIAAAEQTKGFIPFDYADKSNISVQTVYRYLKQLEKLEIIKISKSGRHNVYKLHSKVYFFEFDLENITEDGIWSKYINPLLKKIPDTAYKICNYAFTEMLNNVIEHSEGTHVEIYVCSNIYKTDFIIHDNGVGIFSKIANAIGFDEKRFAVLELAKGKFTTDPESHTGEGIFFSSKASYAFEIWSDGLKFLPVNQPGSDVDSMLTDQNHSLLNNDSTFLNIGTTILFTVLNNQKQTLKELFDKYTNAPDDYGFSKTVVPVRLLEYGDDAALFSSRSQAKRLLTRFDRFERIELDFTDVQDIGQGFADEIFRVFTNKYPHILFTATHCNEQVQNMINRVKNYK